jgi:CshA-type fibril repeat protein
VTGLASNAVLEGDPLADSSLFTAQPFVGTNQNDSANVELGVRFSSSASGNITQLKYYRATVDSSDTDVRTGKLWSPSGALLATVTFTSSPGQSGWQVASLSNPVQILPNQVYTASYHTANNYVATSNFFSSQFVDPSGVLTAPAGTNGVYAYGSGAARPTQSYQSSNYWVDVTFSPAPLVNTPPVFTSSPNVSVAENGLIATTLTASDAQNNPLTFAIASGTDASRFTVNATTGVLRFATAPDFEAPADANGDNVYQVTVSVSDGTAPAVLQPMNITVTDVQNESGVLFAHLFGASDLPASIVTNDPTDYELGVKFTPAANGQIFGLRYYRGTADANDTDNRVLNLWTSGGQNLGSVAVTSTPGQTGWQAGTLTAPVLVTAGTTYIASYGTTQNYAFSGNYFNSAFSGPGGYLSAPSSGSSGGNGVYSNGGPGAFPSQAYQASNYWVDVDFLPPVSGGNTAPIADNDSGTVLVNGSVVIDVVAGDIDIEDGTPDPATVEIVNADNSAGKIKTVAGQGVWQVNSTTGAITFTPATNYAGAVTSITYTIADSQGLRSAPAQVDITITPPAPPPNSIVVENQKPGVAKSIWDAGGSNQIEGFTTDISYDNGSRVDFKIHLNTSNPSGVPYRIEIYRLGYYGGAGATLVTTLNNLTGIAQPAPITDSRGLVDAGNWSVSASWQSPANAVSGVYLARLVRTDNGAENQIPFIIRQDEARADGSKSDILLQTSDTTWHAYNGWGGRNAQVAGNFYGGFNQPDGYTNDPGLNPDRAFAVSYNRPFLTRDFGGAASGPQDYLFGADYAAIYWLERNGYDVSYISGVDTDRLGASALTGHKAYLSVGHDEYWSGNQRANVEAARDAGVNLLFWGGNDVYWKTRYEPSIAGGSVPYRTLVSYKETWNNFSIDAGPEDYANVDPSSEWTGTWRDMRFVDAVDANGNPTAVGARPENSLIGTIFAADGNSFGAALNVPGEYSGLRVWRNTAAANSGISGLAPGILGYEFNVSPDDEFRPAGLIKLSSTDVDWPVVLVDEGNRTEPGSLTHNLTMYRAPSGALVFSAGTVFWTWGLSNQHDNSPYGGNIENATVKQFTVNMFADLGIQPAVADTILASQNLVRASASTDLAPATATLNNLPATLPALQSVLLSGTATDDDGNALTSDGVVAGVEVSVDGGNTWRPAQGKANWSYNWLPSAQGTYNVRVRAIDDTLNMPGNGGLANDTVTVTAPVIPSSVHLFDPSAIVGGTSYNDNSAVELGTRFSATADGQITELRYWRTALDATDTDVRAGRLWSASGNLLGTVTFTSTPGQSGWQTATLSAPVQITANNVYTVSYRTNDNYLAQPGFFSGGYSEPFGVLTSPSAGNGVYAYGSGVVFPTQSYQSSNYWVDVTFEGNTSALLAGSGSAAGTTSQPAAAGGAVNQASAVGTAAPSAQSSAGYFTSSNNFVISADQLSIGRVTAVDPDGDPLTYKIVGGPANKFVLSKDGKLYLHDLPGKGNPKFKLNIAANDPSGNEVARQQLTVAVAKIRNPVSPGGGPDKPPGFVNIGSPQVIPRREKGANGRGPPSWITFPPGFDHGSSGIGGLDGSPTGTPASFYGRNSGDLFVGDEDSQTFFLRRLDDVATGDGGADLFRVNATPGHNFDRDSHTIADLSFPEGDVIRFDQFGPNWANDGTDPSNTLVYRGNANFNSWFVNSIEDLYELEKSGAVRLTPLANDLGTRIELHDKANQSVALSLFGVSA